MDKKEYDIAIIGAGTAGLSAAIYAKRAGKKVLVLEGTSYGGQIIVSMDVDNYPGIKHTSGYEFATNLYEQAVDLGAEIVFEKVINIYNEQDYKMIETEESQYVSKAIIIATGLKKRLLGIDKEKELTGLGVSYCATCDGAFYKGKDVAVNGGGNTALEDALFLSEYCNKVYVIHRREEFRGETNLINKLKEKVNVEFVLASEIIRIFGNDKLNGILIKNKKTDTERKLLVEGLFVAIGQIPEKDLYMNLVETDALGYIIANEDCTTSVKGIFAAGDCRTKDIRQLVTAASDGAIAALAAYKYIS